VVVPTLVEVVPPPDPTGEPDLKVSNTLKEFLVAVCKFSDPRFLPVHLLVLILNPTRCGLTHCQSVSDLRGLLVHRALAGVLTPCQYPGEYAATTEDGGEDYKNG